MNTTLLTLVFAAALPSGVSPDDAVALSDGVTFIGMEAPREAEIGEPAPVTVYFHADDELPSDVRVFVHAEGTPARCRSVRDIRPTYDADGVVTAVAELRLPDTCGPQSVEIRTGLYDVRSRERYQVMGRPTADDRLRAGWMRLVDGDPESEAVAWSPSRIAARATVERLRPWTWWLLGILASGVVSLGLRAARRRRGAEWADRVPPRPASRRAVVATTTLVMVPMVASILAALDFVKDDAYISFRYAHNLAFGDGLVFNAGERLEGITNFLWTLLLVPFEALGWDLFQVCEILGTVLVALLLVTVTRLAARHHGALRSQAQSWGAVWLATASGVGLWATSGLEQPLAMLLPAAGALLLWQANDCESPRRGVVAGIVTGLGCLTRPEIHLVGILLGVPVIARMLRTRRLDPVGAAWGIGLLGVTAPAHLFRYLYYGALLPNTFYVKTGGSAIVWLAGLDKLHEMFAFNAIGALVVLAPLAFADGKRTVEKLVAAGVSLGFMLYVVKVGVDEMRWHRLYLPALPFLVFLAAAGLQNFADGLTRIVGRRWARPVFYALAWCAVLGAAGSNFAFTYRSMAGFNGRADLSGTYHPDMGKFITRHERPHALVAFQDMGSTPYHAPDIDFLDFIGLVDGTVARARHDYGLHAFVGTEAHRNQAAYDAEMRDYFRERSPEWTILTSYVPLGSAEGVAGAFAADPRTDALRNRRNNSYQFRIDRDPWFHENYVHVRTWPRSSTYYLSLFRRRDLWDQTPGEVVLDAAPGSLAGVSATFEGDLRLLGSEIETEATERHELFMTTWWELPGPMEPDILFFVHVWSEGRQVPYDHVPGDWMYPAERWEAGQILEDRVLWQVPVGLPPGEYHVSMGVYRASTGERLAILDGPDDGTGRLELGTITITKMRPILDQLIPPTRIEDQRKYPDRIIDNGRH